MIKKHLENTCKISKGIYCSGFSFPESPGILYEQCTVFQYSLDAWSGMAELEEWKLGDGIPTVGKAGERHRQKLMALKKSINASKPYQVRLGAAWAGVAYHFFVQSNEDLGVMILKGGVTIIARSIKNLPS